MARRGVPRDRRAISVAPSGVSSTPSKRAGAAHDRLELGVAVELEARHDPEAVAQRPGDEAGPGRRADEGEPRQVEADRTRRRAPAEDDVELEVLHRRVEQLLDRPAHPVDLVDEEHVAGLKVGQDRRHVAAAHERRPGGDPEAGAHLAGHDARQRRLSEARAARRTARGRRAGPGGGRPRGRSRASRAAGAGRRSPPAASGGSRPRARRRRRTSRRRPVARPPARRYRRQPSSALGKDLSARAHRAAHLRGARLRSARRSSSSTLPSSGSERSAARASSGA